MYSRHASETLASMSSLVEKAVARYGMLARPSAEPDVLDEVGRVREARLAGPVVEDLEPGRTRHEVDAVAAEVGVRLAVAVVQQERARRASRSPPRRRRAGRGRARRCASSGRPCSSSRRRISGPRISIPTSARTRIASSTIRSMSSGSRMDRDGRINAPRIGAAMEAISVPVAGGPACSDRTVGPWPGWSGMGIPLPLASHLMRHRVPSAATSAGRP